jgi:hypothetical protein
MGGSSQAPSPYQPTGQGQADQNYQQLTNSALPWATGVPSSTIPMAQTAATNVVNNPYYAQAQQGAQTAATQATSQVAPSQFQGVSALTSAGQAGTPLTAQTTQGAQIAPADLQAILSAIPSLTGGMGAANQILQTGFDPQQALYNQQAQQTQSNSNATNAMYGLSESPYGAGVANQNQTNFNIDWQNAQLARQISALSAYGGEQSTVANNLTNLNSNAVGNYNALNAGAAQNYATTTGAQGAAYNNASNLGIAGLNTLTGASQAPSQTYLDQQQADMQAAANVAATSQAALQPGNQLAAVEGNYLGLGQSATAGADQAAQINNAITTAAIGGIASIFGSVGAAAVKAINW